MIGGSSTAKPNLHGGHYTGKGWVHGTWDFKWSYNQQLRIAFQRLRGDQRDAKLKAGIKAFWNLTLLWKPEAPASSLSWSPVADFLPAPPANEHGIQPAKSHFTRAHRPIDYDVLVSFAQLPVRLPLKETQPTATDIAVQTSDLGRYALRADYGVPTLFLGPDDAGTKLSEWFKTEAFEAAVVHEFGHTLGIPHAHQNPLYRLGGKIQLKSEGEILSILESKPRFRNFPKDEIQEEIIEEWPHVELNADKKPPVLFSDWQSPPSVTPLEQGTCMAHPGWSLFLKGAPDADIVELTKPTDYDLAQLAMMYPV